MIKIMSKAAYERLMDKNKTGKPCPKRIKLYGQQAGQPLIKLIETKENQ